MNDEVIIVALSLFSLIFLIRKTKCIYVSLYLYLCLCKFGISL